MKKSFNGRKGQEIARLWLGALILGGIAVALVIWWQFFGGKEIIISLIDSIFNYG